MKITIDTMDNDKIELVKLPVANNTVNEPALKKRKKRACRVHYSVDSEKLLYKLFDAGLLQKMHGVNFIGGKNVWFFSKDNDVKAIIDKFNAENSTVKDVEVAE